MGFRLVVRGLVLLCPYLRVGWGVERSGWVAGVRGTLLGPEGVRLSRLVGSCAVVLVGIVVGGSAGGTDRSWWRTAFPLGGGGFRRVGWGRPYVENCTVDASIFVAKLLRAHGGCLGTRSR